MNELRAKVTENVSQNIRSQCDENTYFYSWSGLDLQDSISLQSRLERMKELFAALCYGKDHQLMKYTNEAKQTLSVDEFEGYSVSTHTILKATLKH